MESVQKGGAGIRGLIALVGVGLFVLLVLVGGNVYRTDCLTARGTLTQSWSFTFDVPFVFNPSETGCTVHVGTRIALNAIGIDTFKPSTPELIAAKAATIANVDPYWPQLKTTLVELHHSTASDTLTGNITAFARVRDALVKLSPTARYSVAHHKLVVTLTALLTDSQQLQQALLRGDRRAEAATAVAGWDTIGEVNADITALNQIHAAQ